MLDLLNFGGWNVHNLKQEIVNGIDALVYYPKVGSSFDESKDAKWEVKTVGQRIRFIPIHDIAFFEGKLNIFQLIQSYFKARQVAVITCSRFFLGSQTGNQSDVSTFFKNQPLGRNTCSTIVK